MFLQEFKRGRIIRIGYFLRIKLNFHKLHEIFMKFYISQIIVYTKSGQLLVNWYESLNPFSMPEFAISNACRELVGIGWRPPHFNCSSVLTWITIGPGDVPGMNEMHRVISLCTILIWWSFNLDFRKTS